MPYLKNGRIKILKSIKYLHCVLLKKHHNLHYFYLYINFYIHLHYLNVLFFMVFFFNPVLRGKVSRKKEKIFVLKFMENRLQVYQKQQNDRFLQSTN